MSCFDFFNFGFYPNVDLLECRYHFTFLFSLNDILFQHEIFIFGKCMFMFCVKFYIFLNDTNGRCYVYDHNIIIITISIKRNGNAKAMIEMK